MIRLMRLPVICLATIAFLAACHQETAPPPPAAEGSKYIVPEAGEGVVLSSSAQPSVSIRTRDESTDVKVTLSPDYVVSQVLDLNLDVDETDEQIIVYKKRDDAEDLIRILVADFDTVRNSYVPSWEGKTVANNVRTFAVYTNDLIGDHNLEIVCFGMNNAGEQTLDVFRRTSSPTGLRLYYTNIGSFTSDASIEIEQQERSSAYESAQTTGQSFPIAVYSRDPKSDNVLDLIKTTYFFRQQENRYVRGRVENIPGARIEEAQLSRLFNSEADAFEDFLSGPWYRSTGPDAAQGSQEIAFFNPQERKIDFYQGDTQESYDWINSYKTIYRNGPGLWINMQNETLATIRRQASVSVLSIDSIAITVEGSETWNGTYRKLTRSLQRSLINKDRHAATLSDVTLNGLYRNDSGTEIFFSPPRFTMREKGKELSGGFSIYKVRDNVLELKILSANGLVEETRTYVLKYSEEKNADRIVRRIVLTPAAVHVDGVEVINSDTITLEQIEEQNNSQDTPAESSAQPSN